MTQQNDEDRYVVLAKDYEQLNEERIKAKSDLEHAEKALANIQQQAKDNYGTDDLKELEQQLENMKQSNQTMINDYEKHIESIRTNLDKVKQEFSQANLSNSDA